MDCVSATQTAECSTSAKKTKKDTGETNQLPTYTHNRAMTTTQQRYVFSFFVSTTPIYSQGATVEFTGTLEEISEMLNNLQGDSLRFRAADKDATYYTEFDEMKDISITPYVEPPVPSTPVIKADAYRW